MSSGIVRTGRNEFLAINAKPTRLPPTAASADAQRVLVGAIDFPYRSWWRLRFRAVYDVVALLDYPVRWEVETDDGNMPLVFPLTAYITGPAASVYQNCRDRSLDINCTSARVYIRRLPRVGVPTWPAAGSVLTCDVRAYPISVPSRYKVVNELTCLILPAADTGATPPLLVNAFDGPLGSFLHPWSENVYIDWTPINGGVNPVAAQIDLYGVGETVVDMLPAGVDTINARLRPDPVGPVVLTNLSGEHQRWPIPAGRWMALRYSILNAPGVANTGVIAVYETYKVS